MKPAAFAAKYSQIQQKESAVAQSHFNDICALVDHLPPLAYDPTGRDFSFETQAVKPEGEKGFADVYFRGHFIWEYKGPHKDLDRAYRQLQLYREALDNPPLLITSDIHTIEIHTNFTDRPVEKIVVTLDDIARGDGVAILRRVFHDPQSFMPERTRETITNASADSFLAVANAMKQHQQLTGESYTPEQLAHFLIRLLFVLFAEDLELLPNNLLQQAIRAQGGRYDHFGDVLAGLFRAMRDGSTFGYEKVRHFNGTLFDDEFVPTIPHDLAQALLRAANEDWSAVDPSIFGTIFERVIDPDKRAQLGAHYTSRDDIMLIVEPVLMGPLREKWADLQLELDPDGNPDGTHAKLLAFAGELATVRVLDPACGSGNFLYVALRQLLDLQKEVIAYAARRGLPEIPLTVGPEQLYGIEINPYAHELAQITAWIGYLQWRADNGFVDYGDPILRPLGNIRRMDAILAYDEDGRPVEPEWPAAEVIIGNPPFLGGKRLRAELGDTYVDDLFVAHEDDVPREADLVTYWFEQARRQIANEQSDRAGLIATNSIRGGANRKVLGRIKETGDIFLAWSDNPWILDGAAVRVSIVGFDDGTDNLRHLDGSQVFTINSDLSSSIDITVAPILEENKGIAFQGTIKGGDFDLEPSVAKLMIDLPNSGARSNREVIKPWVNGSDIVQRPRNMWIIDFGADMPLEQAKEYEAPFEYVRDRVYPVRSKVRRKNHRVYWWLHAEARPGMRKALSNSERFIITPRVAKHRLFVFANTEVLPDSAVIAIARDDDYFFGVLHARPHELWSLRLGTSLEDRPRYTPTTSFETYPFPWPPGEEPAEAEDERVAAIAAAARRLVAFRDAWLNPPPDEAEFLGPRRLNQRTLTNLYNGLVYYRTHPGPAFEQAAFEKETRQSVTRGQIQDLDTIHRALDAAVFRAYGWVDANGRPEALTDEQILERLLALNLERAETAA